MRQRKPQIAPSRRAPTEPPAWGDADTDLLVPGPLPEDADPPARHREAAPMRTLVEQALRRLKLPDQELWREELAGVWAQAVPAELAAVVRPGKWEQGVLYLFVPNSARLFEVQRFHLRKIEAELRRRFDATRLKQVRVMIAPDAGAGTA